MRTPHSSTAVTRSSGSVSRTRSPRPTGPPPGPDARRASSPRGSSPSGGRGGRGGVLARALVADGPGAFAVAEEPGGGQRVQQGPRCRRRGASGSRPPGASPTGSSGRGCPRPNGCGHDGDLGLARGRTRRSRPPPGAPRARTASSRSGGSRRLGSRPRAGSSPFASVSTMWPRWRLSTTDPRCCSTRIGGAGRERVVGPGPAGVRRRGERGVRSAVMPGG